MKDYMYKSGKTLINGKPLKVTEEEQLKPQFDQDLEAHDLYWQKLKTRALAILLAGVVGLNAYGIYKWAKNTPEQPEKPAISYDVNEYVEPIEEVRYVVPEGYTLEYIDGVPVAVKRTTETIQATAHVIYTAPEGYILDGDKCINPADGTVIDAKSITVYSAPSGWTLDGAKCTRTIIETADVATVTTYAAPEGYILIGDKCYKIDSDTPDYAAPEGYIRDGLKCTIDTEAQQSKSR